jgi:hypothetical protein
MSYWWNNEIRPGAPMRRSSAMAAIIDKVAAGGVSRHSPFGSTMLLVLEALEDRKVPYRIDAVPGEGYIVTGLPKETAK